MGELGRLVKGDCLFCSGLVVISGGLPESIISIKTRRPTHVSVSLHAGAPSIRHARPKFLTLWMHWETWLIFGVQGSGWSSA